jgi:hypothetical protein
MFQPATRRKLKLRMAVLGPSGSGKTYTALRFAAAFGNRIAVIDSEHRSASKYIGESPDGTPWTFDSCELTNFAPTTYTQVIKEAGRQGYDVLVIDGLSQAWEGVGGALDQIDRKSANGGNSFTAWKDVTPQHREMIETILACPCHVIATMRTKTEYVLEEQVSKSGRSIVVPKKVGMAPVQRAGMEYEFDVVADMDLEHVLTISKTRCPALDGAKVVKPTTARRPWSRSPKPSPANRKRSRKWPRLQCHPPTKCLRMRWNPPASLARQRAAMRSCGSPRSLPGPMALPIWSSRPARSVASRSSAN